MIKMARSILEGKNIRESLEEEDTKNILRDAEKILKDKLNNDSNQHAWFSALDEVYKELGHNYGAEYLAAECPELQQYLDAFWETRSNLPTEPLTTIFSQLRKQFKL